MESKNLTRRARKLWRIVFGRTTFILIFMIIQLLVLFSTFEWLAQYQRYITSGLTVLSALVGIYIVNNRDNPNYKLAWMIPILIFPVFGAMFYIFVELEVGTRLLKRKMNDVIRSAEPYLTQDSAVTTHLGKDSRETANLSYYISRFGGYPTYENTQAQYFPLGDDMFVTLKEELEKAQHFIFMEYFIIDRGSIWDEILEILTRKAAQGVEVRVMYDGMCALLILPYHFPQELEKHGIRCKRFSPIKPALSTYQNNRDHRKITVIDGHTAFTGGVNLADEYANRKVRFGHWKDTAIMLRGDAVNSFLMMFLQNWNVGKQPRDDFAKYCVRPSDHIQTADQMHATEGYMIPYGDSPLDHEPVSKYIYMDVLSNAKRYVHIMTPYLILDSDMMTALVYAAKRGIEVMIMMPHIPDKKYAFVLAKSYYQELIEAGVRIFEYTPGFIHAKSFVSDDEKAVVGSVNLDYRSLCLHFECGVYVYRNRVIAAVEQDFQNTLSLCQEITLEDCRRYPLVKKMAGSILRVFAPLM